MIGTEAGKGENAEDESHQKPPARERAEPGTNVNRRVEAGHGKCAVFSMMPGTAGSDPSAPRPSSNSSLNEITKEDNKKFSIGETMNLSRSRVSKPGQVDWHEGA